MESVLEHIVEELDNIAVELEELEDVELHLALEYLQQLRDEIELQIER